MKIEKKKPTRRKTGRKEDIDLREGRKTYGWTERKKDTDLKEEKR